MHRFNQYGEIGPIFLLLSEIESFTLVPNIEGYLSLHMKSGNAHMVKATVEELLDLVSRSTK